MKSTGHVVYSLIDLFNAIQPYLKDGYKFDLDSNEGYPKQFGTVYSFTVIEDSSSDTKEAKELKKQSKLKEQE